MDIWEANSIANAVTPHSCTTNGPCNSPSTCGTGDERYESYCDKDGCDFNPYRWGNRTFVSKPSPLTPEARVDGCTADSHQYGPGSSNTVNTNSVFTVVTQFITADGTDTGDLTAIRRLYVQDGEVIQQADTDIAGITTTNEVTDQFCDEQKEVTGDQNKWSEVGGMSAFSDNLDDGMVLVMSIWDDHAARMLWLDSTYPIGSDAVGAERGSCPTDSGVPSEVESQYPG